MDQDEIIENERDTQFDDFPPISPALIKALSVRMPERWPNVEMPERDIWVRNGQWRVVELLELVLNTQRAEAEKDNLNVPR